MMEIGLITSLSRPDCIRRVAGFGLKVCQVSNWDGRLWQPRLAEEVRRESERLGVRIAAVWAGYPGPRIWNLTDGPRTIGLVPPRYRARRVAALKRAARFARELGAPAIVTHCGFIPEDPNSRLYSATVRAIAEVAETCKRLGLEFWFETGQETPVTLLRTIEDVGLDNLGVNLDPANLILYGKASPVDALDVIGPFVRCVHAKDGLYPTDGRNLGREVPVGKGKVNFPALLRRLKELKFSGPLIIEREISGPRQTRDIRTAIRYLEDLLRQL